ncbi:MAG TPA: type II secretion system F family protein, partial [Gemmataceae bacterium]|nr:type II secretion system F family protein [Gemmataceae bacterium]
MIPMLEWMPAAITFFVVTSGIFGLYLMFRRSPAVPSTAPEVDEAVVADQAFAITTLQPKMQEMHKELRSAGIYEPTALGEYTAFRAVAALCVLACTALVMFLVDEERAAQVFLIGFLLAVLAYSLPRVVLLSWRRRQTRAIERDLPLSIDLLVLCLSAGQGLVAALRQTATQLRRQSPILSRELAIVCKHAELRSLEHALKQWSDRVPSPEVRNFTLLLTQSERLGTDSAATLHELANSYRTNSRQRAESQANRTSFWMLFPSVFCFWVAAAIILIGPTYLEFFRHRKSPEQINSNLSDTVQSINGASGSP